MPGSTGKMDPRPDHGEASYRGSVRLKGMRAVITGGDSGIGHAVKIAFAREGADILIAYLSKDDDANEVKDLIQKEGGKAVLFLDDLPKPNNCREVGGEPAELATGYLMLAEPLSSYTSGTTAAVTER